MKFVLEQKIKTSTKSNDNLKMNLSRNIYNRIQMSDPIDLFDYSLPTNSVQFQLLKVVTYDIHNARVNAKKLRSKVPSTSHIEFELAIKNLDIDIIQCRISHSEYLKKYTELVNSIKSSSQDIENARVKHLNYVNEFVMLRYNLAKRTMEKL